MCTKIKTFHVSVITPNATMVYGILFSVIHPTVLGYEFTLLNTITDLTSIWERERERNVLFNDALNTFYLQLYGIRHMVKDHSDSEKGNPLPPHRLLLSINSKGSFICTIPQTG